jgi:hypothetical protein
LFLFIINDFIYLLTYVVLGLLYYMFVQAFKFAFIIFLCKEKSSKKPACIIFL